MSLRIYDNRELRNVRRSSLLYHSLLSILSSHILHFLCYNTSMLPQAILFDLDGTLLDSFPAHVYAYRTMFERLGMPVDEQSLLAHYAPNWLETYRALGIPPERWQEANTYWMEEAARHTPPLLPGARDLLRSLQGRARLGIVTSGSRPRVERDLAHTGIRDFFEVIITGDDVTHPKPHPEGLLLALQALGISPAGTLYIGDTLPDYEMACSAGAAFIGILGCFPGLHPGLPCRLVRTLGELGEWLEGF